MSALSLASRESGGKAPVLVVETSNADTSPPSAPAGLNVTATDASSISFSWSAASDDVGVTGYGIYRNGGLVASSQQTSYTMSSLTCGTNYSIGVDAVDAAGNRSSQTTLLVTTAACPDTASPTNPSGLTVKSASTTGISLGWTPSTDNVAVAGYDLFLNGTKTASTTSASYNFSSLTCDTSYSIGVQAYDATGNRSSQVSIVAMTSACTDTSAPLTPTGLLLTAATSTSISAAWNPSFDNVAVTGYHVYVSSTRVGTTQLTSYTYGNLTCGTTYTIGVDAYDAAGNTSTVASVMASTAACAAPAPQPGAPKYRYLYDSGSSTAIAQDGWNLYDVSSKSVADALPAGSQSLYWVGDYNNSTCSWDMSDSAVSSEVQSMVGDSKIFGYFISDEPNPYACPNAPAQHKARTALIHSIDPAKQVVIVLDSNGFSGRNTQDALDQIPLWKGTADAIGLDPYPCYQGSASCDFSWIDRTIQAADAAGIPYWGVVQAFNDSSWRWPTLTELNHMLTQWGSSHETGTMTFAWTWAGNDLTSQPTLLDALKTFNTAGATSPTPPPTTDTTPPTTPTNLTATATTTSSISLSWAPSTDNIAVTGYGLYRGGALVGSASGTTTTFSGLPCNTSQSLAVDATDAAGNRSGKATLTASTAPCPGDTTPPSTPTNFTVTGTTSSSISVSWNASTDNIAVTGYGLYRGGALVGSASGTTTTFSGLPCNTSQSLAVDATDAAGNRSGKATLTASTAPCPGDTTPPSTPTNLTVTSTSQTGASLSWTTSSDNVGVTGYNVFRGSTLDGTSATTTYTASSLNCGTAYTFTVQAKDAAGNVSGQSGSVNATTAACSTGGGGTDPVITAAGDICGSSTDCKPTSDLVLSINPTRALTLGDNAYSSGTVSEYSSEYDPNWGRFKAKTSPAPGNHEYDTSGASGYFSYFGSLAPAPYYSYDLGSWHLISLASSSAVDPAAGSAEETWLRQDLAAHPNKCTLAYWHEPRWSSGTTHGSNTDWDAVWQDLYAAHAEVVLNGHEHNYERFARQNPSGGADPNGIREIIAGTGGVSHGYPFGTPIANSEVRNDSTWGVLKLTLHPTSYDWQFVPIAGSTFTDSGSDACS